MKFYINSVPQKGDWNNNCIGLFTNNQWTGEGNFCGYYSSEYFLDTTLLAYGIQKRHGGMPVDFKAPFDGGFFENVNEYHDKIMIGSGMWTEEIETETADEAIEIFKNQTW